MKQALARVVASEPFRNAPRLSAFLTFLVEKTLSGEAAAIKGYTIATQALGRSESFDPQTDPIVRVEAGRLRRALEKYYGGEGADDPLRIVVPVGNYVPVFELRDISAPDRVDSTDGNATAHGPKVASGAPPAPRRGLGRIAALAAAALIAVAAVLAAGWYDPDGRPSNRANIDAAPVGTAITDGRPVVVVLPTTVSGMLPQGFSASLLRSVVLDRLARFDEVAAVERPARPELTVQIYLVSLRLVGTAAGATVMIGLTHEGTGELIWSREFPVLTAADLATPPEIAMARQIATTIAQPYGVLFADLRSRALDPKMRCIIQGLDYWHHPTAQARAAARECLEGAVEPNPQFGLAYAHLVRVYASEPLTDMSPQSNLVQRALRTARRAIELAPESARAHQALMAAYVVAGRGEEALEAGRRALELNDGDTDVMADLGARYVQGGDYKKGVDLLTRAAAMNPVDPPWYDFFLFLAAYMQNDFDRAREAADRILTDNSVLGVMARAVMSAHFGENERARQFLQKLVELQPEFARDPRAALSRKPFAAEIRERLLSGLQGAGLKS